MKKFLKIIIIIAAGTLVLGVLYWVWLNFIGPAIFGAPTAEPVTTTPVAETVATPGEIATGLNLLSNIQAFGYWLKANGDIYILAANGNVIKISSDGAEERITTQTIETLHSLKASNDGSIAAVSFGYPFQETFTLFDTKNNTWQPLPPGITAVAWDPKSSNRLAYLKSNGRSGSLVILNLNNQQTQEILKINILDAKLDWVEPNTIYISEKPSAKNLGSLWSVNINQRTLRRIIADENGLITTWSSNGSLAAKSNTAGLFIINKQNQILATLAFPTIASKCTFNAENLYCAVPQNTAGSALALPDDYLKREIYFDDQIYEIPLTLGIDNRINDFAVPIVIPSLQSFDAEKLKVVGDKLYFINRYDQKLYQLALTR